VKQKKQRWKNLNRTAKTQWEIDLRRGIRAEKTTPWIGFEVRRRHDDNAGE
jgi:hypothetical protein